MLPPQWGDGYESCVVIGLRRGSRRFVTVVIRTEMTENWRADLVYSPTVLRLLAAGYRGFERQWSSREEVDEAVTAMNARSAASL